MRSSAIAEKAISMGIDCVFVGSISDIPWLQHRIMGLGFSDIVCTDEFNSNSNSDVLVLDSYTLGINDTFIQPERWKKTVLIADTTTPNYRADLIIHPGIDGSWYKGDISKFLSGYKFIPLRSSIKMRSRQSKFYVEKIIIFGGGTDAFNFGFAIANELRKLVGFQSATFFSNDVSRIQNLDLRFKVCDFGSQLDLALDSADLVFTTASTSALEVIARGIPVGIASAVPNQSDFYQAIGQLDLASPVGDRVETGDWVLDSTQIQRLIDDRLYRADLVNKGLGVIDFQGSARIIAAIIGVQA